MTDGTQAPLVLGGDVQAVFKFGKPEDYETSVGAAMAEQELICGYKLKVVNLRQTHYQDEKGNDVYEVYASFARAPSGPAI